MFAHLRSVLSATLFAPLLLAGCLAENGQVEDPAQSSAEALTFIPTWSVSACSTLLSSGPYAGTLTESGLVLPWNPGVTTVLGGGPSSTLVDLSGTSAPLGVSIIDSNSTLGNLSVGYPATLSNSAFVPFVDGSSHLYGAYSNGGSQWLTMQLDTQAAFDRNPSSVTFNGQVLAFYSAQNGPVFSQSSSNLTNWQRQTIVQGIQTADPYAIVYNGLIYVFFYDITHNALGYVTSSDGAAWSNVVDLDGFTTANGGIVTPGWFVGAMPSATVTSNNELVVFSVHEISRGQSVRSAIYNGSSWTFGDVDGTNSTLGMEWGRLSAFSMGPYPAVAYRFADVATNTFQLRVAAYTASTPSISIVDGIAGTGCASSIAIPYTGQGPNVEGPAAVQNGATGATVYYHADGIGLRAFQANQVVIRSIF
jgi:hypothetical protein